ncbi:hypothetical protein ACLOJK_029474 [Asimina triloba]
MADLADLLQRRQIGDHGNNGSELQQIRAAPSFLPENPSRRRPGGAAGDGASRWAGGSFLHSVVATNDTT